MRIEPGAPNPQWSLLEQAFESSDVEIRCFYDLVSGEVCHIILFDDLDDDRERIEEEPDRYLEIERVRSREAYRWMERFAREEVGDSRLRERLLDALSKREPFRRFQDVLQRAPATCERWYAYHAAQLHGEIERWFEAHDLPVGAPPPWRAAGQGAEARG